MDSTLTVAVSIALLWHDVILALSTWTAIYDKYMQQKRNRRQNSIITTLQNVNVVVFNESNINFNSSTGISGS